MRKTSWVVMTLLLLAFFCTSARAQKIGIVTDFDSTPIVDSVIQVIVQEINRTTGAAREVTLSEQDVIYQTNTLELARSNYDQLEPNVDLMILIGSISTKGALSAEINTPTIG
ncbi:MAG: hypothetical protein AAGF85_08900, partial [Bacteroidota bacterium]